MKSFQRTKVFCREQGTGVRMYALLMSFFFDCTFPYSYRTYITAERMEVCPRQIGV